MSEFWALVLGSALGVLGGIAGTWFTYWLSRKKELRKERKEAYITILKFCNRLKFVDSENSKDVTYDYITDVLSKTLLYASDMVVNEYKKIHNLASDMLDANEKNDSKKVKSLRNTLISHINIISAQMKRELKLENKRSKELLSNTIYKKLRRKNKNGD